MTTPRTVPLRARYRLTVTTVSQTLFCHSVCLSLFCHVGSAKVCGTSASCWRLLARPGWTTSIGSRPTEAHAPVDEPATSADELDEDDEAVCLLSSLSSLHPGAWVVLHSLVRKPELNGRVCVLIGQNDGDADRWDCHVLLEGRAIAVKPDNLSVVAPCTWKSAGEWRREEMERTEAVV